MSLLAFALMLIIGGLFVALRICAVGKGPESVPWREDFSADRVRGGSPTGHVHPRRRK